MSWQDHIVECRNIKTGQTANFVYTKYAALYEGVSSDFKMRLWVEG